MIINSIKNSKYFKLIEMKVIKETEEKESKRLFKTLSDINVKEVYTVDDIKGKIDIDYPTSSNPADGIFDVGSTERIQWTPTGTFDYVQVQYSTDNGTSYNDITGAESISASQGYYDWQVYDAVSDTVRIRVSNTGSEPVDAGISDQIAIKPTLTITAPTSSSFWEVGKTKDITLQFKISNSNQNQINVTGETKLKMSDFGIDPPTAMLATLKTGDDITIKYNIILQKNIESELG